MFSDFRARIISGPENKPVLTGILKNADDHLTILTLDNKSISIIDPKKLLKDLDEKHLVIDTIPRFRRF